MHIRIKTFRLLAILTLILFLSNVDLICQAHKSFKADFTIMERNSLKNDSKILKGKVNYSKPDNRLDFLIHFPESQKWIIIDSTMQKYRNDTLFGTSVVRGYQDLAVFKELLELKSNDFGLREYGFEMADVSTLDGTVYVEWLPPTSFKTFIKSVTTASKENLLQGVIFTDVEDKDFSSTLFEDYTFVADLPIPLKITQHFIGKEENIFKTIYFENIEVK